MGPRIGARGQVVFGGRVPLEPRNFIERAWPTTHAHKRDLRDWDQIAASARHVATKLTPAFPRLAASPSPPPTPDRGALEAALPTADRPGASEPKHYRLGRRHRSPSAAPNSSLRGRRPQRREPGCSAAAAQALEEHASGATVDKEEQPCPGT